MLTDGVKEPLAPIYILVHGTFQPRASWTRPGSLLRLALSKSQPGAEFVPKPWTGHNLFSARQSAADNLEAAIRDIDPKRPVFIIGHSHGGSAVARLLHDCPKILDRLCGVAYLATPFIALRKHEYIPELWSSLTILKGLYLAFIIGVVSAVLAVAIKAYESDLLTPVMLFGPAALVCAVIVMTFRRLIQVRSAVDAIRTSITDYCRKNETAAVSIDERIFLVRATGDEAASLLAFCQFLGLLSSRIGTFTDRALIRGYHAFGRMTRSLLGKALFAGLVVTAQMWIIFTARYYNDPSIDFYPWSVPDNIYIDFLCWETPTRLTPYVRYSLYPIAIFTTFLYAALALTFVALATRFITSIICFRVFGSWAVKQAMFMDFSVEPLPYGASKFHHASWHSDIKGEFLQHSRTYTNPLALAALADWCDARLALWRTKRPTP